MNNLATVFSRDAKHWANNFAGLFMVAVTMFIIVIAVSRQYPSPATSAVLWLLGTLGICSLCAWGWFAYQAGKKNVVNSLFRPQ